MKSLIVKKTLLLFLSNFFLTIGFCQDKNSSTDISVLRNHLLKADVFMKRVLYDSAVHESNMALQMALKSGAKKIQADAYNILAEVMMVNGKMTEVRKYDSILGRLALQLNDTALIVNTKNRTGIYLLEQGRTKEASEFFLSALELKSEKEQSLKTAEIYSNLGSVYMAISKKDQAAEWFFKALKLYEKLKSDVGQGETYSNLSSIYYLLGRTDDAIDFQKKSIYFREKQNDIRGLVIPNINIGQLYILKDSFALALRHLKLAVTYAEKISNIKLKAGAYSGMSAYHSKMKEYGPALEWQNKAIALFEETDNKPLLSRMYVSAGNLANATNDSAGAVNFYRKALDLSLRLGNKENIANAYEKMNSFYLSHNDYTNAYKYYKNFTSYRDSIATAGSLAGIEKIKIQYETEKKDNEIIRLNADQKIKQLQIEKQKALISGNLLEAQKKENEIELLSKAKELQELKISQQDEQLERQILLAKTNEQQLQLAEKEKQLQDRKLKNSETIRNFILAGIGLLAVLGYFLFNRYQLKRKIQQQEALLSVRNNIAQDLHDEIGSTLTSIKILSEVSEKNLYKDRTKASSFLQKITEQSTAVQQGISDIVWSVKPENDTLEKMVIRMREYAAHTLESKNIQTVININEQVLNKTLDMGQRRDFFLIYKEAVNNISKYADATEVHVALERNSNKLRMVISDNGKGFDVSKQTSSSGLKNMRARAAALNGTLDIHSTQGKGSEIMLTIPTT